MRGLQGVGAGPVGGALVLEDVADAVLVTLQPLAVTEVKTEILNDMGNVERSLFVTPVIAEKTIRGQVFPSRCGDPPGLT